MIWRRFARLSEKASDAQFPEGGGDLGNRLEGLLAAARLRANRHCAEDLPLRHPPSRGDDSEFCERLRRLGAQRRRFGYRRLHILLRREGIKLNHKKLFRTYRQERLTVRRRGGRKRALGMRAAITLPQGAKPRWSLDFVSDVLADGRRFRVLAFPHVQHSTHAGERLC